MELELVSIFILFENLKSTYASTKGYPYKKGYYRRLNNEKLCFKELLDEMFQSVGMTPNLEDIIKLRNEIIHSGISELSFDKQQSIYYSLRDISREYFVRLLGYTGNYYTYSGRGAQAVNVSTTNHRQAQP